MARNKKELTEAIDRILDVQSPVDSIEEGAKLRKQTAEKLANEIDTYVQFQIGSRLQEVLTALSSTGSDGNPVPLVRGPNFETFTRTSSN